MGDPSRHDRLCHVVSTPSHGLSYPLVMTNNISQFAIENVANLFIKWTFPLNMVIFQFAMLGKLPDSNLDDAPQGTPKFLWTPDTRCHPTGPTGPTRLPLGTISDFLWQHDVSLHMTHMNAHHYPYQK